MATHSQAKYCSLECSRLGERESWNKYGRSNKIKRRAYHRKHYERNRDSIVARTTAYHQSDAGRKAQTVADANARIKFPEKVAARESVRLAVQSGRLTKEPCVKCGAPKTHGHHEDYSKPLDVVWLCKDCHAARHREMRQVKQEVVDAAV